MATQGKTVWGGRVAASILYAMVITIAVAPAASAQHGARLSDSLRRHVAANSTQKLDVIVHGTAAEIAALAERHHVQIKKMLTGGAVLSATGAAIGALSAEVDHLSRDVAVTSFMAVTDAAIGADQVQAGLAGLPGLTGRGVGIAFVDSGIWAEHRSLAGRVVASVDFVGDGIADTYGHGTHVAAIAAGDSPYPQDSTYQIPFRGVAPGANLISLRVIGADGSGLSSDVVEAIEWAIRNRKRYNIRVINLSLGHPPDEPYRDDPMCEAVERAVHAGIVVVAAAGNRGKNAAGESVYGTIDSPGNDPYAITVGALNTRGTVARSDDVLATYSSKGPTFDGVIKPDIVAPGNKIVSAEAAGSSIVADNPTLHVSGSGIDGYMTMSGTSMSAAVVSGAVALVLEGKEKLSPAEVKATLQYSSTFLPDPGLVGAGAGSLNVASAIQVGNEISDRKSTKGGMFDGSSVSAYLRLGDHPPVLAQHIIWGNAFLSASHIIWTDHIVWDGRTAWENHIIWEDHLIWGD